MEELQTVPGDLDAKVVDSTLTYMHAGLQHHIVFKHKLDFLMSSTVPIALAWLTHRLHAREGLLR